MSLDVACQDVLQAFLCRPLLPAVAIGGAVMERRSTAMDGRALMCPPHAFLITCLVLETKQAV